MGNGPVNDAFRTFFRTGLAEGPVVLSRRELGCGGSCDGNSECTNCGGCLIEVEFSIIAGNPFMHRETVQVCETQTFEQCDTDCPTGTPIWVKINTTAYPASATDATACIDLLSCEVLIDNSCLTDPLCPVVSLPEFPEVVDACGCDPLFTTRVCCEISKDNYGLFFEGIPGFEIFSGTQEPMRNVVISLYENPQERTCDDEALFQSDCFKCATMTIRYIPKGTTIKIDGLTKRITAKCPGQAEQPAESLTTSAFTWPTLKCISYIATIEVDCAWPISYDATAKLFVTAREM